MVNGRADEKDLARLRAHATTSGTVTVEGRARVFVRRGGWVPATGLSARELRRGVELGVEATDVRRPGWDGRVTVTLTAGGRSVSHRLTVAPLLLQHDLQRATMVFAARPGEGPGRPEGWQWPGGWEPHDWASFSSGLAHAGAPMRYVTGTGTWWQDVWWQDLFEPTYARANGQTMRFAIRSANIWDVGGVRTPRPAARAVFRDLRGPDVAVVQATSSRCRRTGATRGAGWCTGRTRAAL